MTTTATQLAAALEAGWACDTSPDEMTAAAAELRRLDAEVDALREGAPITDERINAIADLIVKGMPEGVAGFCKSWGWRQFARALLDDCAGHYRAAPVAQAAQGVPADLTPLAKRRIFDAIRAAYDLGWSDRQNGTHAAREVEKDHGDALISGLAAIAYLATPAPTVKESLTPATAPAQAQQAEQARRKLWDMLNGAPAQGVPADLKVIGYYHKAESGNALEDDFYSADAINGDCPACHPCYIDASVTVHPTPVQWRVPEGWKLVPVTPTPEMLQAADDGDDAYTLRNFGPGVQRVMQGAEDHWAAMLAATPAPAQAQQAEPDEDHGESAYSAKERANGGNGNG